jgi:hypothetical protein
LSNDLPGVNPATLNGMIPYYCLMTKWSGLGDSTELSRMVVARTSLMEMAAMKLGNTPRPVAWCPPVACFPPPVLILATSSSKYLPHLAVAVFW